MNSLGIQHKMEALRTELYQKKKHYMQQTSYCKKRAKQVLSSESSIKLKQQLFSAFQCIKKMQTDIQNILMGSLTLTSYFEQKLRERDVQCDLNTIEVNQLKVLLKEEKSQKQKLILEFDNKSFHYLQNLDIKQFECRELKYRIQDLQQQIHQLKSQQYKKVIQSIQKEEYQNFLTKGTEEINFLKNQLIQIGYFKDKYKEQKDILKEKIQYLQELVEELTIKIRKQEDKQWNFQNFQNQEDEQQQNKSFSFKDDQNESNCYQNYPSRYQLNSSTQMPIIRDILDLTQINSNEKQFLQGLHSKQRSIYDLSHQNRKSSLSKSKSINKFRLMYTKQKQNFSYNTLLNGSNQNKDINVQENTISLNSQEQFSCRQFKSNNDVITPRGVQQFCPQKNQELFQIQLSDTEKIKSYETNKKSQIRQSLKNKQKQQNLITIDPYQAFFSLTAQCIKLNSKNFNKVISVHFDITKEYNKVLNNKIPMNLWGKQIKHRLQILLGQQI